MSQAGAVTGIVSKMLLAMWAAHQRIAAARSSQKDRRPRLAYALPWEALAAMPLFLMMVAIGNERFGGEAIEGTRSSEGKAMLINGRVADDALPRFRTLACSDRWRSP